MNTTNPPNRNLASRYLSRISYHNSLLIILPLALACIGLGPAPRLFGVSPPPDGGYAGGNTAEGSNALFNLTSGVHNTATGYQALFKNTTGNTNMATGSLALFNNTSGVQNMAIGFTALYGNTSGSNNAAVGSAALHSNTTASQNTAIGSNSMYNNTTGTYNTAIGYQALYSNINGSFNTANGYQALFTNIAGANTAIGDEALYSNTTGDFNTASGTAALYSNITGELNTATGHSALYSNTAGGDNTAYGYRALDSNTTGSNNTALGTFAGLNLTVGDNNIDIGYNVLGVAGESNTIRIGNTDIADTYIRGISGQTASGGDAVFITSNGKLGTMTSSARFKDDIKPMGKASEAILALRPVSFRYKKGIDPQGIPQFGLVAEDVEAVNPDLVVRDEEGKPYSVRYEQINAMLLNEFLKEHRKNEEQEATITQLKSTVAQQQKDFQLTVARQQKQIAALTVGLQKVSSQVEISRSGSQTVFNNQ